MFQKTPPLCGSDLCAELWVGLFVLMWFLSNYLSAFFKAIFNVTDIYAKLRFSDGCAFIRPQFKSLQTLCS